MEEYTLGAERMSEDGMDSCDRAPEVGRIESDCHVDEVRVTDTIFSRN